MKRTLFLILFLTVMLGMATGAWAQRTIPSGVVETMSIAGIQVYGHVITVQGELRITGLETDFGDQTYMTPGFTALQNYVSRAIGGKVTALAPAQVGGVAKWMNIQNVVAGIINNIEGSNGDVQINFPGTGTAFNGVSMDLGAGYNTIRYNGANMDNAGTITHVNRLISIPSSVGDFVRVLNYDLSKLGSNLVTVWINPMSRDGEVTYTNAPIGMDRVVIIPAMASYGYEINKVKLQYAGGISPTYGVTVEVRKTTTYGGYNVRNLDRIGEMDIFAQKVILDVTNLTVADIPSSALNTPGFNVFTNIQLVKANNIQEIVVKGPGKPILSNIENPNTLEHISLSNFTGQLQLSTAFNAILPVVNGMLTGGWWVQTPAIFNVTQSTGYTTIQAAINAAVDNDEIELAAGTYAETLNIEGKNNLTITGLGTTIIQPTTVIPWGGFGHPTDRSAAIRVVNSDNLTFGGITLDCVLIRNNGYYGVLYGNSTGGTFENCIFKNMYIDTAHYYDIMVALRSTEGTETNRQTVSFLNNQFIDTGRVGILAHDFVNCIINGNTFSKTTHTFGYAMEIGSQSIATINDNEMFGYDTPAVSDNSTSAAMYIENCFTNGITSPLAKHVTITNNDVHDNQSGLTIGNQFSGMAGNVDMILNIAENTFTNNADYGILITDEDKINGSSVTATLTNNHVTSTLGTTGAVGIFVYAVGDGDLNVTLDDNIVSGYENSLYVNDYGTPAGSLFVLSATGNTFSGAECGVYNGNINWLVLRDANPLYEDNSFVDDIIVMDLSDGIPQDMDAILANNEFVGGAYESEGIIYGGTAEMLYVDAPNELIKDVEMQVYSVKALNISDLRGYTARVKIPKAYFSQPTNFAIGSLFSAYPQGSFFMSPLVADVNYWIYDVSGSYYGGADGITGSNVVLFTFEATSLINVDNTPTGCLIELPLAQVELRDDQNPYQMIACLATADKRILIDSGEPTIVQNNAGTYPSGMLVPVLGNGSGLLDRPILNLTFADNYNLDTAKYLIQAAIDTPPTLPSQFTLAVGVVNGLTTTIPWQLAESVNILDDGTYTVYFQAIDDAGNPSIIYDWDFIKDTAPTLPIIWCPDWTATLAPCRTTANQNNSIDLMWTNPVGAFKNHVWALSYSNLAGLVLPEIAYPEYPTTTNPIPVAPNPYISTPQNGWTRVGIIDAAGAYTWTGMARDYYYITVFAADAAGNISAAPAATFYRESISYWPGDVNVAPDGLVTSADISLFSAVWGLTPGNNIMDVGPSVDYSRRGRPVPDNRINIEDLMMFSMNYNNTNYTHYFRDNEIPEVNPIRIEMNCQNAGDQLIVQFNLGDNTGFVKGLNIPVLYGSGLTLQSVVTGDVWPGASLMLNTNNNNVFELSGSTLGQEETIADNGNIATLTFNIIGSDTNVELQHMIARTTINSDIEIIGNPAETPTGTEDPEIVIPAMSYLGDNYPNPFNPNTNIQYGLKQAGNVTITIYNTRGQVVKTLVNATKQAGTYKAVWNGMDNNNRPVSSGVYFYKMQSNEFVQIKKGLLLK